MRGRKALAPLGPPALQHQPAVLGCHSRAKAMCLRSTPVVRLKSGLSHQLGISLLRENGKTNCRCRACQETLKRYENACS